MFYCGFQYLLHVTTSFYVSFTVVRIQINMRFLLNNFIQTLSISMLKFYQDMSLHHWILRCESLKFVNCNARSFVQAKPHVS
jgi:hypothetical protein